MEMTSQIKELVLSNALAFTVIFFIFTFAKVNIAFFIALAFVFFFYFPASLFVEIIKNVTLVEKYVLTHLLGLSYGAIYVVFDVILKIPLTKAVYVITTVIFIGIGLYVFKNQVPDQNSIKQNEKPKKRKSKPK